MTDARPPQLSWAERFRGAMLGGAVGDALGAGVRDMTTSEIQQWFGWQGVVDYLPVYGRRGAVTDLTQLTVFTLEALLRAKAANPGGNGWLPTEFVYANYLRWLHTQGVPWEYAMSAYLRTEPVPASWLLERPELYSTRNPGGVALTMLGRMALRSPLSADGLLRPQVHFDGMVDFVAWSAPVMVWSNAPDAVFSTSASLANLFTSAPNSVSASGMHADVLAQLIRGVPLWDAVTASDHNRLGKAYRLRGLPADVSRNVHAAMFVGQRGRTPSPTEIDIEFDTKDKPGELGIALAAVGSSRNFADAVRVAVNHSSDSAVTGALAGQLAGAIYGPGGIPGQWLDEVELREIFEILCADAAEAFAPPPPPQWAQRYAPNSGRFGGPRELVGGAPNTVEGSAEQTTVMPAITADLADPIDTPPQGIPAQNVAPPREEPPRAEPPRVGQSPRIGAPTFPTARTGTPDEPLVFAVTDPSNTGPIPVPRLLSSEAAETTAVFPAVGTSTDPGASVPEVGAFPALAHPAAPREADFPAATAEDPVPPVEQVAPLADESPQAEQAVPVEEPALPDEPAAEPVEQFSAPEEPAHFVAAEPEPAGEAAIVVPAAAKIAAVPSVGEITPEPEFSQLSKAVEADAADVTPEYVEPTQNDGETPVVVEEFADDFAEDVVPAGFVEEQAQTESVPVETGSSPVPEREPVDLEPPARAPIDLEPAQYDETAQHDATAEGLEPGSDAEPAETEYDDVDQSESAEPESEPALPETFAEPEVPVYAEPLVATETQVAAEPQAATELPEDIETAGVAPSSPAPAVPPIVRGGHAKADRPDDSSPSLTERVLGCFLGGALGDALGSDLEFVSAAEITARFGADGPSGLREAYGVHGAITDDTQMTLFTAEGLIRGSIAHRMLGSTDPLPEVQLAYQRWLHTQGVDWESAAGRFLGDYPAPDGWLVEVPGLFKTRAPGKTVFRALARFGDGHPAGSFTEKINDSKGCGGVMRAAPVALWSTDPAAVFRLAARTAALTHSHPAGYQSAGALAVIVQQALLGRGIDDGVWLALQVLETWDDHGETTAMLKAAVDLAEAGVPTPQQVAENLGGGWVGEEALAIAVCAALVGGEDVELALRIAVHHDGDSDSTGAICGNIMGALLGVAALPLDWLAELELRDVVEQVALDSVAELGYGAFRSDGASEPPTDEDWNERYPVRPQWSAPERRVADDDIPEFPAPKPAPRRLNGVGHTEAFEGENT